MQSRAKSGSEASAIDKLLSDIRGLQIGGSFKLRKATALPPEEPAFLANPPHADLISTSASDLASRAEAPSASEGKNSDQQARTSAGFCDLAQPAAESIDGPRKAAPPPPEPKSVSSKIQEFVSKFNEGDDEGPSRPPPQPPVSSLSGHTGDMPHAEPGGPSRAPPPPPPPPHANSPAVQQQAIAASTSVTSEVMSTKITADRLTPISTPVVADAAVTSTAESTDTVSSVDSATSGAQGDSPEPHDSQDGPRKAPPPLPPPPPPPLPSSPPSEAPRSLVSSSAVAPDMEGPCKAPPLPPSPAPAPTPTPAPVVNVALAAAPVSNNPAEQAGGQSNADVTIVVKGGSDDCPIKMPTVHNSLDLPDPSKVFRARVASLSGRPENAEIPAGVSLCSVEGCTMPAGPQRQCLSHFVQSAKAGWGAKERNAARECRRQSTLRGTLLPGGRAPQSLQALLDAVSGVANSDTSFDNASEQTAGSSGSEAPAQPSELKINVESPTETICLEADPFDEEAFIEQLSKHYAEARASVTDNATVDDNDEDENDRNSLDGSEIDEQEASDLVAALHGRTHRVDTTLAPTSAVTTTTITTTVTTTTTTTTATETLHVTSKPPSIRNIFPSPTAAIVKSSFPTYVSASVYQRVLPSSIMKTSASNSTEGSAALYLRGGRQHSSSIVPLTRIPSRATSPATVGGPGSPRIQGNPAGDIDAMLAGRASVSRSSHSPLSEYDPQWQRDAIAHAADRHMPLPGTTDSGSSAHADNSMSRSVSSLDFATNLATGPSEVNSKVGTRQRLKESLSRDMVQQGKFMTYEKWRLAYAISRARQTVAWTTMVQPTGLRHAGLEDAEIYDLGAALLSEQEKESKEVTSHLPATVMGHPITHVLALESLLKSKKGQALVRNGIPIRARPIAWLCLLRSYEMQARHNEYYETCIVQLSLQTTRSHKDIVKDVKRTMQYHPLFQSDDGTTRLTNILSAFSFKNPQIGYCQSMNIITAILMLFYPDADAFWMLDSLVGKIVPSYYLPTMIGVRVDLAAFELLVSKRVPQLARHMASQSVSLNAICVSWFMCLYVEVLPLETALRVWDIMLVECSVAVLFRVGLALLVLASDDLLKLQSGGEIVAYLSRFPSLMYDCDQLISLAHERQCNVTQKEIDKLRAPIRKALEEEHLSTIQFINRDG